LQYQPAMLCEPLADVLDLSNRLAGAGVTTVPDSYSTFMRLHFSLEIDVSIRHMLEIDKSGWAGKAAAYGLDDFRNI